MGARNYSLELLSLQVIILHNTDFAISRFTCQSDLCALLISIFEKSSSNKLKGESMTPAAYRMEFYMTLINGKKPLTNITMRSIIDVGGLQDKGIQQNLHL